MKINILEHKNKYYLKKGNEFNTFSFHSEKEAREFVALGINWSTKQTRNWEDIDEESRFYSIKEKNNIIGEQVEGVLTYEDKDSFVWGNCLPKTKLTLEELKAF